VRDGGPRSIVSTSTDLPLVSALGDGITQIRLPMTGNPLRAINGYLIEDDGGLMLVDCGWKLDEVLAALEAGVRAAGHAVSDIRRVLITHHHYDHYGLAGTLRRAGVAELLMHARDWDRAQRIAANRAGLDAVADAWLARNGYTVPPEADGEDWHARSELAEPTRLVGDGERIGRLEAIWTPGHAPGHLCFADTVSGRVLTGDHVLNPITPHIGSWTEEHGDPLGDYLLSLAKIAARESTGALPAHGEPFADLRGRVAEIVAHTDERDGLIVEVVGRGSPVSAGDVARALPWTRRLRTFESMATFHQQFAVSETIAHLEHLRVGGRVTRDAAPDRIVYQPVA
jgi:glyoxylase-like metal-dependent hydrolase (beta-lactamase superfamily II)